MLKQLNIQNILTSPNFKSWWKQKTDPRYNSALINTNNPSCHNGG